PACRSAPSSSCTTPPAAAAARSPRPSPLLRQGTDKQIEQYLKPLVRGEAARRLALTEPNAGSDAFHLTTTAVRVPLGGGG
ncbi:acyl-CoA dehydrogenase family protein, partial [Streptomyces sp. URMC 124]